MRLSKTQFARTLPYPLSADAEGAYPDLPEVRGDAEPLAQRYAKSPAVRTVADLIDLVADRRGELLNTFLKVLEESRTTRRDAAELMALVTACGLTEAPSPCATAIAIYGNLEKLIQAADRWTHPAQIVRNPASQALALLCEARIETESGVVRERLEHILPRLQRAARLTRKAASRRVQDTGRPAEWVDRWL
ncbi:MAG: hypothetical protein GY719_16260 [bacterium]|nr:hypothetical protein [bacterium]